MVEGTTQPTGDNRHRCVCSDKVADIVEDCPPVRMDFATVDLRDAGYNYGGVTSQEVMRIRSNNPEELKINKVALSGTQGMISSDVATDEIYVMTNGTIEFGKIYEIFYVDADNDVAIAGNVTSQEAQFAYFAANARCKIWPIDKVWWPSNHD